MQVDFYFQLLRRFHPEMLSQTMRATVRNFIKQTNLDTYERMSEIYDYVVGCDPLDHAASRLSRAASARGGPAECGSLAARRTHSELLDATYARKQDGLSGPAPAPVDETVRQHELTPSTLPAIPAWNLLALGRDGNSWTCSASPGRRYLTKYFEID